MKKALTHIVLCLLFSCSAQKKQIIIDEIKEVQPDTLIEESLFSLHINDYDLTESLLNERELVINESGLYQYKDSTLVNAKTKIWLHKFPKIDKNKISDSREPPISYGYLEGKIINGKKEGKWLKKIKTPKQPHYVIVKILHYANGVLDGKYQVYNTNGRALFPLEPHPLFPDEFKDYETFKNGTGFYYDYYYETETIKTQGYYKNNQKNGRWVYYNESGNEIMREYYSNQILINE